MPDEEVSKSEYTTESVSQDTMREKAQQIEGEGVKELQIRMMVSEPTDEIMSPDIIEGY